jgi:hypothetical protein
MPDSIVSPARPPVNVPIGPLDALCSALACLASDLADVAQRQRTARAARLATISLEVAVHVHLAEAALARLASEVPA